MTKNLTKIHKLLTSIFKPSFIKDLRTRTCYLLIVLLYLVRERINFKLILEQTTNINDKVYPCLVLGLWKEPESKIFYF